MAENINENNDNNETDSSSTLESVGILGGIAAVIGKVRKSVSKVLSTSTSLIKKGFSSLSNFLSSRLGYTAVPAVANTVKETIDKVQETTKPKELAEKNETPPSAATERKLLNLPTGLAFIDREGNTVHPDKKIGAIKLKGTKPTGIEDENAPKYKIGNDGSIEAKSANNDVKKYHLDTLLDKGDSFTAFVNESKPEKVRVLSEDEVDLFQQAA